MSRLIDGVELKNWINERGGEKEIKRAEEFMGELWIGREIYELFIEESSEIFMSDESVGIYRFLSDSWDFWVNWLRFSLRLFTNFLYFFKKNFKLF